jgi:maleylpyruvate isomerase
MTGLRREDMSARAALRVRQGAGARYDSLDAPQEDLLMARHGTACFARKLAELCDAALDADSLRAGPTRRQVIARVGYQARALAERVAAVRAGRDIQDVRVDEAQGVTLPARALRSLIHHSAIHLDVEWRDLREGQWDRILRLQDGTDLSLRQTPRLRAVRVWQAALDLGNGARLADVPAALLPLMT